MERRQREKGRQVKVLLQEIRRLRDENESLQIQVSLAGPSRSRQPRSQRTNSRQNEEAMYPGNAKSPPNEHEVRPNERPLPAYYVPHEESYDSTCIS